jgi:hypothetical protein
MNALLKGFSKSKTTKCYSLNGIHNEQIRSQFQKKDKGPNKLLIALETPNTKP